MGWFKNKECRSLIDRIQDGYFEADLGGTLIHVNQALCDACGYPRSEMIGTNFRNYTDRANAQKTYRAFEQIYKTKMAKTLIHYVLLRKDRTRRRLEISASLMVDPSGKPIGFRGTTRDITSRSRQEENLRRSEERYRTIIEDMGVSYFETDLGGRFTFVNEAFCKLLGFSHDELVGAPYRQRFGKKNVKELFSLFNRAYRMGAPIKVNAFELHQKDGSKVHCEVSISLIKDKEGEIVGFRGVSKDITKRKEYEEQIRHLATHDILTGLPNRFMFNEILQQNIDFARRYKQQFALLFMDLDGFKTINDTFGHETGDQMLIECAAKLQQALRSSDFIARLGGDEFVILVRKVTGVKHLTTLVNKILTTVREPIFAKGRRLFFTASIGISIYPQDGEDKQSLMKSADLAMYSAKEKGSNNYQFFSLGIKSQFQERSLFEKHLPRALARGEFFLEYQPKLNLKTGVVTGVEALLRWRNPSLGLVTPIRLIPVAESTGLIVPIGRWILKTACLQNVDWQRQGLPRIAMAVNLSHRQLMDDRLIDDVKAALWESDMEPELLELEITENLLITYFPRIINILNQLNELGVRLALDDFGSGYSSLAQIRHLPVNTLKIDRSIVGNVLTNRVDLAMAKAIVGIGKALNLTIVAEGVETSEQLDIFKDPSCDEVQGFYFSKPLPPEEAAKIISKKFAIK